jgi:hypothetical protein
MAALTVLLLSSCTYTCDAQNCADGCCAPDGVCLVGHTDRYCGLGGVACEDCSAAGKICSERVKPGVAATWSCDYSCSEQLGKACQSATECCASQICFQNSCSVCRAYDAECQDVGDCCNGRQCRQINFLYRCR